MNKAQEYVTPSIVTQVALRVSDNFAQSAILDAGYGTGLLGQALNLAGAKIIYGADLSSTMLKIANETGVFRSLSQADLTRPVQKDDGIYDLLRVLVHSQTATLVLVLASENLHA